MRKIAGFVFCCLLLACAIPATAQSKTDQLGRVYVMTPKPGMTKQFEAGRKRHMDWHKKQNDSWGWFTWQVETGPYTGSYLSTTFGHTWSDFDTWEQKLGEADNADSETNLTPSIASSDQSIWLYMKDFSRAPDDGPPQAYAMVEHYLLKPGTADKFEQVLKKINEAVDKTKWPVHYAWYSLVNGGTGPHYVLLIPSDSYAGLADPDMPFPVMLENGLGKEEAQQLLPEIYKPIDHEWTELLHFRGDLSYLPKQAK